MAFRNALISLIAVLIAHAAEAETEIAFFGGYQWAAPSQVTVAGDTVVPDAVFDQDWSGYAFEWPVYQGLRLTRWNDTVGFGLEYVHNKAVPPGRVLPAGYRALEFSDGLNSLTLNAYRRWPDAFGPITPYVGAGAGISFPGVEIRYGSSDTFEYQITGIAVSWIAGIRYPIGGRWDGFVDYRGSYSTNDVSLETGGTLATNISTSAVNVGVIYGF